jgi:hypothetical protein
MGSISLIIRRERLGKLFFGSERKLSKLKSKITIFLKDLYQRALLQHPPSTCVNRQISEELQGNSTAHWP